MIFWIEKQFKNESIDSAAKSGIRCVFPKDYDEATKNEIVQFTKFIRANYYFPIMVKIIFYNTTHFAHPFDGHRYYGVFFAGDEHKHTYYGE